VHKFLVRCGVFILAALIGTGATGTRRLIHKQDRWIGTEARINGAITSGLALSESEDDELLPSSLSPFDIKSFINAHPQSSLTKLWQALSIDPRKFEDEDINSDYFPANCQTCKADTFEYDLDGQPGSEVLLRVAREFDPACRFLIFKYAGDKWKLLGHIDASGKYRMPQHTIILSGGLTWLAIQSQGASGSGVASYFDRLFLVRPTGITKGIAFTSEAYQSGYEGKPTMNVSGRIVSASLINETIAAEIEYSVEYGGADPLLPRKDIILFAKNQKALIVKSPRSRTQWVDRGHSDAPESELDAVYNVDSLSDDDFLKYNYQELSGIARGRNSAKKEWLRRFLGTSPNTAEHRRLSRMLAQ
jgi:hypothetical protein